VLVLGPADGRLRTGVSGRLDGAADPQDPPEVLGRGRRPLLVGEAPSKGKDGCRPFSGRSGRFLERLIGIDRETLGRHFDLENLVDRWPGQAGKGSRSPVLKRGALEFWERVLPRVDARSVIVLAG